MILSSIQIKTLIGGYLSLVLKQLPQNPFNCCIYEIYISARTKYETELNVLFCVAETTSKMSHRTAKSSKNWRILVRVSGEANQGGRKDMEDFTSVVFDREHDGQAFFGVFDGHGGKQAAVFARDKLWETIKKQRGFYSNDSAHVVKAIKEGFMATHRAMWKQLGKFGTEIQFPARI